MAELTELVTYKVRDLEVDVEMDWEELQRLAKAVETANETSASAVFELMTVAMKKAISDIRGLTRKGKPVVYDHNKTINQMSPALVKDVFAAMMNPDTAVQASDPLVAGTSAPMG